MKYHYFVVAAHIDDKGKPNFIIDDEMFMTFFDGKGVYDEETDEWVPRHEIDTETDVELSQALAEQLGK